MSGPRLTPLRRIPTGKGDVLHAMKASDPGFCGFGEAYFSQVLSGAIKGWKRHRVMTLNLVCISGAVRFVIYANPGDREPRLDVVLSPDVADQYQRLTVPPGMWTGFEGVAAETSMLLNVASIQHDPAEQETVDLGAFPWPVSERVLATTSA